MILGPETDYAASCRMHVKVGDPPKKALPAALMLVMCLAIVLLRQA